MKKSKKIGLICGSVIVGLPLLLWIGYIGVMSSYAWCNWWLPLAGKYTPFQVSAKSMNVSLFSSQTCRIEGLLVRKSDEMVLTADHVAVDSALLDYLRGKSKVLAVGDVQLANVKLSLKSPASVEPAAAPAAPAKSGSSTPTVRPASVAKAADTAKNAEKKAKEFELPVTLERLSIERFELEAIQPDRTVQLTLPTLQLEQLKPGKAADLRVQGVLNAMFGQLRVRNVGIDLNSSVTLPEKGLMPRLAQLKFAVDSGEWVLSGAQAQQGEVRAAIDGEWSADGAFHLQGETSLAGETLPLKSLRANWDFAGTLALGEQELRLTAAHFGVQSAGEEIAIAGTVAPTFVAWRNGKLSSGDIDVALDLNRIVLQDVAALAGAADALPWSDAVLAGKWRVHAPPLPALVQGGGELTLTAHELPGGKVTLGVDGSAQVGTELDKIENITGNIRFLDAAGVLEVTAQTTAPLTAVRAAGQWRVEPLAVQVVLKQCDLPGVLGFARMDAKKFGIRSGALTAQMTLAAEAFPSDQSPLSVQLEELAWSNLALDLGDVAAKPSFGTMKFSAEVTPDFKRVSVKGLALRAGDGRSTAVNLEADAALDLGAPEALPELNVKSYSVTDAVREIVPLAALRELPLKSFLVSGALRLHPDGGFDSSTAVKAEPVEVPVGAIDGSFAVAGKLDLPKKEMRLNKMVFALSDADKTLALEGKISEAMNLFWGAQGFRANPVRLDLTAAIADVTDAMQLAGVKNTMQLAGGSVQLKTRIESPRWPGAIQSSGSVQLGNLAVQGSAPLDFDGRWDLTVADGFKSITLAELRADAKVNRQSVLRLDGKGTFPLSLEAASGAAPEAHIVLTDVNEKLLAAFPLAALRDKNIRSFSLRSELDWRDSRLSGTFEIDRLLYGNLTESVSAAGELAVKPTPEQLTLERLSLRASSGNRQFADIGVTGIYAKDASAPLSVDIQSELIDLDRVMKLSEAWSASQVAAAVPEKAATAPQARQPASSQPGVAQPTAAPAAVGTEPAPLDLSAVNGQIRWNLHRIVYQKTLEASVSGNMKIVQNQVEGRSNFSCSGGTGTATWQVDTGVAGGYPYQVALNVDGLQLEPLTGAFNPDPVNGSVDTLRCQLKGRGFSAADLQQRSNGQLDFTASNIAFSAASGKAQMWTNVLFMPLELLVRATEHLETPAQFPELMELKGKINDILSGKEKFKLASGHGSIRIDQGDVRIDEVVFDGGTLKQERVSGRINLIAQTLTLSTGIDFGSLIIPLDISGPIASPAPDYGKFVLQFTRQNLENMLKPENIGNTIQQVEGIINMFNKR